MSSPRLKRRARPLPGDLRSTPSEDDRNHTRKPYSDEHEYVPSDDEDYEPIPSSSSSKRRKTMTPSVSVQGRRGDSVNFRVSAHVRKNTRVQASMSDDDYSDGESLATPEGARPQQENRIGGSRKIFIPVTPRTANPYNPSNPFQRPDKNHELLRSLSVKGLKEILHNKEKEEEEEARKKQEVKEKKEAKEKKAIEVENAKRDKSELGIEYAYDFDVHLSNSAKGTCRRWFIRCASAKSEPEKIFIPRDKVPQDLLLYVEWNDLTEKEKVQYGNSFKKYLDVMMPGFASRRRT